MPIYTFYPCRADGSSTTFVAIDLAGDEQAVDRAQAILAEHPSCAWVSVWAGERAVFTYGPRITAAASGR